MTDEMEGQEKLFDADGWSGRTCQEPSPATTERILEPSSKKQLKSQTKMPLFLNLRGGNGVRQDVSWETDGQSLGEYMMPSIGECRRDEREYVLSLTSTGTQQERLFLNCSEKPSNSIPSRLSDILERNPDPKYNLSQKACQGILNRAERRGKALPEVLKDALERQAHVLTDGMSSQNISSPNTESQNPCMPENAEEAEENPM